MPAIKEFVHNIQDRFFNSIVSNRLVYNTCWEDPEIDRALLNIQSESSIVMLTSAGCNALDYLLDNPHSVFAVDANPSQTALLELKKAFFRHDDHDLLFDFFGRGFHKAANQIYERHLKCHISPRAREFWDHSLEYFSGYSPESSFYFRGTSGNVALFMHRHIKRKGLYGKALKLLNAESLDEQKFFFEEIDPLLWSGFYRWLLMRDATMTLLGVPLSQRDLIESELEGGLYRFIKDSMEHVFTRLPVRDNYFWRVYITGSYTEECCPNYLKETYFNTIRNRIDRIYPFTSTLTDFLEENPGSYSHFVLLDHLDWMGTTRPDELNREWNLILANAQPGARILFRSAGAKINFLPGFVYEQVEFHPLTTGRLHKKDRVGTYGSTHLGVVRP